MVKQDFRTRLVQTYLSDPDDEDPNTADGGDPLEKGADGVVRLFAESYAFGYRAPDATTLVNVTPYQLDEATGLWWAQEGVVGVVPGKMYVDLDVCPGYWFFRCTKTQGAAITGVGADVLTTHFGER